MPTTAKIPTRALPHRFRIRVYASGIDLFLPFPLLSHVMPSFIVIIVFFFFLITREPYVRSEFHQPTETQRKKATLQHLPLLLACVHYINTYIYIFLLLLNKQSNTYTKRRKKRKGTESHATEAMTVFSLARARATSLFALAFALLCLFALSTFTVVHADDNLPKPAWQNACSSPFQVCSKVETYRFWG